MDDSRFEKIGRNMSMSIESTMSAKSLNPNVSNKFRHLVNMQVKFGEKAIHRDRDLGLRFWQTIKTQVCRPSGRCWEVFPTCRVAMILAYSEVDAAII